jgi:hypothetical protein
LVCPDIGPRYAALRAQNLPLIGLQTSMLQAFFVTFVKQGRLWELEHCRTAPDSAADILPIPAAGPKVVRAGSRAA